jgi:hypothetical protein
MAVDAADVIAPRLGIAPELRILEINAVAAVQVIELAIIHAPVSATAVSKSTVPKHRVHRCTNCQAASREPSLAWRRDSLRILALAAASNYTACYFSFIRCSSARPYEE